MSKKIAMAAASAAALMLLTACGTKVNHDSAQPTEDIQTRWVRIETPPAFATMMFTCIGGTGIYMDQGDGNMQAQVHDPLCPIANVFNPAIQREYGFRLVIRINGRSDGQS